MGSSADTAVFDATVLVRALVDEDETAREWTRRVGSELRVQMPEFAWVEFANALRGFVRSDVLGSAQAFEALELLADLPFELHPTRELAAPALGIAIDLGLTAYDAAYLALARALDAPLITFDADFAGLYDRLELLA